VSEWLIVSEIAIASRALRACSVRSTLWTFFSLLNIVNIVCLLNIVNILQTFSDAHNFIYNIGSPSKCLFPEVSNSSGSENNALGIYISRRFKTGVSFLSDYNALTQFYPFSIFVSPLSVQFLKRLFVGWNFYTHFHCIGCREINYCKHSITLFSGENMITYFLLHWLQGNYCVGCLRKDRDVDILICHFSHLFPHICIDLSLFPSLPSYFQISKVSIILFKFP